MGALSDRKVNRLEHVSVAIRCRNFLSQRQSVPEGTCHDDKRESS